jgi:alpha-tubulin suppressor-like RCC1 family protein/uncharacterized protein YunC (DUF1805 family)
MSQTKVQLIAPIGVVTASTLETTGVLTATTFVGDIAGTVTGITSTTDNLNLGIITATSFAGDFTGIGSGLTGTPNIVAGVVTATKFVGNSPGTVSGIADGTNINAGIITATSFVGNLTGNAAGLSTTTAQLTLGIVTATSYSGSGANLDGVSSGPVAQQAVTANSSTTTIDLSSGNLIYMTQTADTTVAFASTEGNTDVVYLVRIPDGTARTLTWPSGFVWNGGTEPNLASGSDDYQVFKLTTRDNGATWYGNVSAEDTPIRTLYAWGRNYKGLLGLNQAHDFMLSSPVQIPGTNWVQISSLGRDGSHFNMIKNDNTLWSWGYNDFGMLGQNNRTNYSSPVQVGSDTTWDSGGATKYGTSFGVKTDGTLWSWGRNLYGELGLNEGTNAHKSSPVQVPGTTWASGHTKGASSYLTRAQIKTDGTLWAWGNNDNGILGQNDIVQYSSPVQIPGTTWSIVGCNYKNIFAIKTNGELWAWGSNYRGLLGQNQAHNVGHRSSPVQIPGTNWSKLGGANATMAAIKTDGTLWCWGTGGSGEIGNNIGGPGKHHSSPVQVPGTTWSEIGGGSMEMLATKTDNTLWAWGSNTYGGLGQNNRTNYSSPTQIPGTNWTVTRGNLVNLAIQKPTLN